MATGTLTITGQRIAKTGKPIIPSTGMASLGEIGEADAAARGYRTVELPLDPASPEGPRVMADFVSRLR